MLCTGQNAMYADRFVKSNTSSFLALSHIFNSVDVDYILPNTVHFAHRFPKPKRTLYLLDMTAPMEEKHGSPQGKK